MMTDPDYYDAKIAGWWVWGASSWIGSGWCDYESYERKSRKIPELSSERGERRAHLSQQRPHLTHSKGVIAIANERPAEGRGINRKLPSLTGNQGVNRQLPHVGDAGRGVQRSNQPLYDYMHQLAERLRRVRVCCGDWTRVCTPAVTFGNGLCGVFLDPPYSAEANRDNGLYAVESKTVAHDVRRWCLENGDNPLLRVALCGYDVEHQELEQHGWTAHTWKANGGYGNQGEGQGKKNAKREVIFFSPHCLKTTLFEMDANE